MAYPFPPPLLPLRAMSDATDMNCASTDRQLEEQQETNWRSRKEKREKEKEGDEAALLGKDFVSFCHKLNTFFHGT